MKYLTVLLSLLLFSGCSTIEVDATKYVSAPENCEWGDGESSKIKVEVCAKVQLWGGKWIQDCSCTDWDLYHTMRKESHNRRVEELRKQND